MAPDGRGRAPTAPAALLSRHAAWSGPGLALSSPEDVDRAHGLVDALVLTARAVLAAAQHDPDVAHCAAAGCGFARTDHQDLCRLAHHLANGPATQLEPPPFAVAFDAFAAALRRATEAIGVCRRTAHPHGSCWFSPVPGVDGCAAVLRGAHRVG